ncbi:hypothetical protein LZC95_47985 [Pendulispora brunnea]|uniref:Uncharacterized protein n=1 Tax=Pendulispora brunnea TaxID=2905690 RepID=A0ABZ2K644_9BACT
MTAAGNSKAFFPHRLANLARAAVVLSCIAATSRTALAAEGVPQAPPAGQPSWAPHGTMSNPIIVQLHPETGGIPTTVALSGPRILDDWEEGQPIPNGYHMETRIRRGLVIGGAIPFGIFYVFSLMAASISADAQDNASALLLPALGPFIQAAQTQSSTGQFFCALDGIVQTGGLAMLIGGLVSPKTVLVRNDLGFKMELRPVATHTSMGVGLGGSW